MKKREERCAELQALPIGVLLQAYIDCLHPQVLSLSINRGRMIAEILVREFGAEIEKVNVEKVAVAKTNVSASA